MIRVSQTGQEILNDRVGTRKGYTGHLNDTAADLVYMKARYYDAQIGRFYSNDPVGFSVGNPMMFNRYAYAKNNAYLYFDPDGRDSIYVARPLSGLKGIHHGFVITTDVDKKGNHTLRQRFSFGPVDQDGKDPLRNVTGTNDDTDKVDKLFADQVISALNSGEPLPDSVFISNIDAPEIVVEAIGNAILGNNDYETLPDFQPGPGANSNSAANYLANRATEISGGEKFSNPNGAILPGGGDSNNILVDDYVTPNLP